MNSFVPNETLNRSVLNKTLNCSSSDSESEWSASSSDEETDHRTGLKKTTVTAHRALWKQAQSIGWPATIQKIEEEVASKGLARSTHIRKLSMCFGAQKSALAHNVELIPPPKTLSSRLRYLKLQLLKEQNLDLIGATKAQVVATTASLLLQDRMAALFLALMWTTTSRASSIRDLRRADVVIDQTAMIVSLRFRTGKTIRATGIYTLHVALPRNLLLAVQLLTADMDGTPYLFGSQRAKIQRLVSNALKENGLEIRAIRRGAIRCLGLAGIPPSDIRLLSRHTTDAMLYQYAGGGMYLRHELNKTAGMTRNILWDQ